MRCVWLPCVKGVSRNGTAPLQEAPSGGARPGGGLAAQAGQEKDACVQQQRQLFVRGEVVTVSAQANRNYRLTSREAGPVLSFKNQYDPPQYWIKVDASDRVIDDEGGRGFLLVNKATGMALSHRSTKAGDAAGQEEYRADGVDEAVVWTGGRNEGGGCTAVRAARDIDLNLDAAYKHGRLSEGDRPVLRAWNKQDSQKWMIAPAGPQD